jgi:hypothetical protein
MTTTDKTILDADPFCRLFQGQVEGVGAAGRISQNYFAAK